MIASVTLVDASVKLMIASVTLVDASVKLIIASVTLVDASLRLMIASVRLIIASTSETEACVSEAGASARWIPPSAMPMKRHGFPEIDTPVDLFLAKTLRFSPLSERGQRQARARCPARRASHQPHTRSIVMSTVQSKKNRVSLVQ